MPSNASSTAQNPGSKPPLKNPILYSSLVLLAVLLYVMWIFFARWQENRQIQRQATEEKSQKQLESDRKTVEEMGGKELSIQSFYASAGIVHKGESLQLCYGVANAKTVKLEPQDNPVWPSYNRCVDVTPKKDTTYTLTIQDAAGNSKSQTLDIKVK
jgi:cytoskeletal protein RodZ